ncbi:auxin-responsive protein SAUR71-like [Vicia villosa]|uniref:auxin-responsive protein SAUR71-like n=1 Tax=Vicia villosa TaxID=3911 RepID=UPI00273CA442|nr:auxin-responsive protein SAUR71-like [Vicia villosa]
MNLVKKCKRVWGSSKRLCDAQDSTSSGSYGKLSEKCHKKQKDNTKKAPNGCLCVYVGPERQRFVIKIKIFNHPLFKTLLEGVENEYGYRNDGPLWLPCHVDMFCEALVEIESDEVDMGFVGCNFPMSHKHSSASQYSPLSCRSNLSSYDANYEVLV